ncbi:hypothetical protein K0M31_011494 [Melipona bicolor]|uniref:Uncharacterized protein n=1 Tax=Melipona bicolor TaxID=60889 RepID=A0AA40KUY5_9HYME|nr:hypothetical protein K0M31_011494 [Melipona bicolor]
MAAGNLDFRKGSIYHLKDQGGNWDTEPKEERVQPKKEKTEQSANGAVSPSGEPQANQGTATTGSLPISAAPPNSGDQQKPNRPNTLEARVVTRRLILFDSEYSRSVESLSERSNLFLRV